jgi:protoheme IX farnesyltransferase
MPYLTGMSGFLYLVGAVGLGLRFLWYAFKLYASADDRLAMPTFGYSILYLFALFSALMIDHYLWPVIVQLSY